jgi:hypothetical protein
MKSALEQLRELREGHQRGTQEHPSPQPNGGELVPVKQPPPADEIGAACPDCGSTEKWKWIDGSLICRRGLIQGDHLGRLSERQATRADNGSAGESIDDHGHHAAGGRQEQTRTRSVDFVDVFDSTLITDFLSACSAQGWPDISRRHDCRRQVEVYTFQASAANAVVAYLLTSASCFTSAVRAHIAADIRWRLQHGVAGGIYTPHQDPKAPSVLATQMPLFGPTSATTVWAN